MTVILKPERRETIKKGLLVIAVLCLLPLMVSANTSKSYINSNNVVIPYDIYQNFKKLFPDNYIEFLTEEEYQDIINKNINYDSIKTDVKYFKTEYNKQNGKIVETELTKEEYNSVDTEREENTRATVVETAYKRIALSAARTSGNAGYMVFTTTWKKMPKVRSFDVIATRLSGATKVNGTQSGKQFYTANGSSTYVNYSASGTNINNQSNGFGISMNLVDNATKIECVITSSLTVNSGSALVSASYQHATTDVTLATSKNYTLATNGLGGVIKFNGNIGTWYDGMSGTYIYI